MKLAKLKWRFILLFTLFCATTFFSQTSIKVLAYETSTVQPGFYNALYVSNTENILRARFRVSNDNGKTWAIEPTSIKNLGKVPNSSQRNITTSIYIPEKNILVSFFNSLDNPQIAKYSVEPIEAQKDYYLRYRVSNDNGVSWLFDSPLVSEGNFSQKNPFPGIWTGKNSYYIGDFGSKPIINNIGEIILPVQATILPNQNNNLNRNNLYNPWGTTSYTDVMILRGKWENNQLVWKMNNKIEGDPKLTTRGLIEPTIAKLENGNLLCVMRGSNGGIKDPTFKLLGYKWASISEDDGQTWSKPKPWTYDDGNPFYSPSSMSILFTHSNGRCYWVGNISESNTKGNLPRFPLVMGEVDQKTMTLIKSSIITLDTQKPDEKAKGNLDLGHTTIYEDRVSKEIVVSYQRIYSKQKQKDWVTIRLKV